MRSRRAGPRRYRAPGMVAFPGRPWVVSLLVLVAIGAAFANWWWTRPAPVGVWARHAMPAATAEDAEVMRRAMAATDWDTPPSVERKQRATSQEMALQRLGDRAGAALVRALLQNDADLSRNRRLLTEVTATEGGVILHAVRERKDPAIDAALLAIATDDELHIETRDPALIVLCRPGNAAVVGPLVDVVLRSDPRSPIVEQILLRIARCGAPLPPTLRALLETPTAGIDVLAALALAASGDPFAPSAVSDFLTAKSAHTRVFDRTWSRLALAGALRLVRDARAPIDEPLAAALAKELDRLEHGTDRWDEKALNAGLKQLAPDFAAWLEVHPELRTSDWEVRRAASRERAAREPGLRVRSLEDILALGDDEIDIGASLLVLVGRDPGELPSRLAMLDRVTRTVEARVRGAATPRETLERMQAAIVPDHQSFQGGVNASNLETVLRNGGGNCVGWTSVFLAVGERLGLPLHPVEVPGHMFVRWDDGTTQVNIDPNNHGEVLTDAEYERSFAVRRGGRWLRNLKRREFLASVMSNESAHDVGPEGLDPRRALEPALIALRLDPNHGYAVRNALAAIALDPAARGRTDTAALARRAMIETTTSAGDACAIAEAALRCGLSEAAADALDAMPEPETADADTVTTLRAWVLAAKGRFDECERMLDPLLERKRDDWTLRALELALSAREGDAAIDAAVRRIVDADFETSTNAVRGEVRGAAAHMAADLPHPDGEAAAVRAALRILGAALDTIETADGPRARAATDERWLSVHRTRREVGLVHAWLLDRAGEPDRAAAVRKRIDGPLETRTPR